MKKGKHSRRMEIKSFFSFCAFHRRVVAGVGGKGKSSTIDVKEVFVPSSTKVILAVLQPI